VLLDCTYCQSNFFYNTFIALILLIIMFEKEINVYVSTNIQYEQNEIYQKLFKLKCENLRKKLFEKLEFLKIVHNY